MTLDALYHRRGWKPKPCKIVDIHDDGTVDLADENGEVFVTHCPTGDPGPNRDGWVEPAVAVVADPPKRKRGRPRKEEPIVESLPDADLAPDDEPAGDSSPEAIVHDTAE